MGTKRAGIVLFLVIYFTVTMVFSGCGPEKNGSSGEAAYIIGDIQGDWGYPTPFAAYPRGPGNVRISFLFDTLVWKDAGGFIPALAEEWEYNSDNLSYTFVLREEVKWHDGTPFSAEDVVFTFNYLMKHPSNWTDVSPVEAVTLLDERRVSIKLHKPEAAFLNNIACTAFMIPRHIWEGVENPHDYSVPEAVVGTGPYKLADYQREKGVYQYKAFEDYYLGKPAVDDILMVKVSDAQFAMQRGDVNYVQIQPEGVSQFEGTREKVISGNHDWNLKLMFNHNKYPFSEKKFRHAVAHAINLEELVERSLRGYGLPGSAGLISPDSSWFNPKLGHYDYNPQKTEEILERMGYRRGESFFIDEDGRYLNLELIVYSEYTREAEIVKSFLEQVGIKVQLRSLDQSVVDAKIQNWDFDLAINGHGGIGGDPAGLAGFMVGESRPHINSRYDHPDLIEKLQEQRTEMDEDKRRRLVNQLQEIYAEELPAYTLYYPTWYYAHDGRVDWFFTHDGLAGGTPIPLNKIALLYTGG